MLSTTRRRAAVIFAGSALVAGLGVTATVSPAAASPTGQFSPQSVCGWQPANDAGLGRHLTGQAWMRRGGDTSCGELIVAGKGDTVTIHCKWRNNVTGALWDYLHDDQRSTTAWLPASVVWGGQPSTNC